VIRKLIFRIAKWMFLLALFVAALVALAWFYPEKFLCVDSGKNVSADVIVVLGGGPHEQRAERAAELFKAHAAPRILLSGAGDDGINRQILLAHGVPASAIAVENKSASTHENAEFSLKILRAEKVRSVILVTSWYHARRALKTFEHAAPELKVFSRPSYFGFSHDDWKPTGVGKRMRLEFLKTPAYWLRYGVNPF
jgi:uncharacterized SAM-binding protein YcdF (DUF218 family)